MEEAGSSSPEPEGSLERSMSDSELNFDLLEEFLSGDCWIKPPPPPPTNYSADFDIGRSSPNQIETDNQEAEERSLPANDQTLVGSEQLKLTRSRSSANINQRLYHALTYIKDSQKEGDVLVQLWVPTKKGDKHVLTTRGQPYWFDANSDGLASFRTVSMAYQFPAEADKDSKEALGLPGRVFIGKLLEWTPDVRYFSNEEYPRVGQAQRYNVQGSFALPVFGHDSQSCIGVIEVVFTTQKVSYGSHLENICNALQAVDLSSSEGLSVPRLKVSDKSYQAALPEIREVLKVVCDTHGLPLAQTWITCIQQGKEGNRHSNDNYRNCISTIDTACYVNNSSMLGFHEACSEHHLLRGQGVAGKAFTTNQPCFSPDITSFIKAEYPLSHHAKLFHLKAAVAIRLRSAHSGNADFVLEFFLPVNCTGSEQQREMLYSLSITVQQVCQSLRVVSNKELDDEAMLGVDELVPSDLLFDEFPEGVQRPYCGNILSDESAWNAGNMGGQEESLPQEFSKQDELTVSALPEGMMFSECKDQTDSTSNDPSFQRVGKTTEKRRVKAEKSVSLEVLRKYFAGSLKDAASSIGVCPTTLKRICRQHGITRWPSRKIKKVGHSLKKLQGVIDSVHGAEGTFKFSSVYENFSKAFTTDKDLPASHRISKTNPITHQYSSNILQQREVRFSPHNSASNSLSSSTCSQSSSSSLGRSIKKEDSLKENQVVKIKRRKSELSLHILGQELSRDPIRLQSHKALSEHFSLENPSQVLKGRPDVFKVKAIYGEEKVRFRLQPTWGFQELLQETVKRFNIADMFSVYLKYLDDDSEWVLLTCDADLDECVDVYKYYSVDTIKISVQRVTIPASIPASRASI